MSGGISKALVLRGLKQCREGSLDIACGGEHFRFGRQSGDVQATLAVHDDRFFRRVLWGGDVGLGDSYVDGEWSSPDLVNVVRFAVRNVDRMNRDGGMVPALAALRNRFRHPRRTNHPNDSRENIAFHYDLGNDFYRLFLDPALIYSCAIFDTPDESLESAQRRKLARIAQSLDLRPRDHLLEIGTGWGGFALYAAQNYGCHVTTTTISRRQHEYAKEMLDRAGEAGSRVRLLFEDYRDLRGSYDKIVSIEMFEAVGIEHYDDFFGSCDRVLAPGGAMFLQTITMNERRFAAHVRQHDWIERRIFPGAQLASIAAILECLSRGTRMRVHQLHEIGLHYATTLRHWRERFLDRLDDVRGMGFDDRFIRTWEYYLASCEGAFAEEYIGDAQILMRKMASSSPASRLSTLDGAETLTDALKASERNRR
ncbi:MAG: cyclopropane-fatty-acyl-phospholipid synthase family protein [Candidatus Acidiferrales bacterium]